MVLKAIHFLHKTTGKWLQHLGFFFGVGEVCWFCFGAIFSSASSLFLALSYGITPHGLRGLTWCQGSNLGKPQHQGKNPTPCAIALAPGHPFFSLWLSSINHCNLYKNLNIVLLHSNTYMFKLQRCIYFTCVICPLIPAVIICLV